MINYRLLFDESELTNSDLLEAPKYNLCINSGEDFCLGNAASAEVSLKTKELTSSSIGLSFNLFRDEGLGERNIGIFTIKEAIKNKNGVYIIKAYDRMINFDIDVSGWLNNITFPITLTNFLSSLCTYCDVPVNTSGLVNGSRSISQFTASSISGRTILKYISQASGKYAVINENGVLVFKNYTTKSRTLTSSLYKEADLEDYICPEITGLWIGKEDGDVGTSVGTNTNVYKIYNNPLLYGESLTTPAINILNQIKNRPYTAGTVKIFKLDWLVGTTLNTINVGDIIHINNNATNFLVMELSWDAGGITLKGFGLAERSTLQSTQDSINAINGRTNVFKRTLDETISEITDIDGRLTNVVQDVNGLSVTVVGPENIVEGVSYTVPSDCEDDFYDFILDSDTGWFHADNIGQNNSYAICRVAFTTTKENVEIPVSISQRAENGYDFGIVSKLDQSLYHSHNNEVGHDTVLKLYRDYEHSQIEDEFTITVASPGVHYIEIKYYKDSSSTISNEHFYFKLDIPSQLVSKITLDKGSAGISSAEIKFDGLVTFNNLANNDGTTVINGGNITTGYLSANRIQGGVLSGSEININSNFTVDSNGRMTATDALINAGNVTVSDSDNTSTITPNSVTSTNGYLNSLKLDNATLYGSTSGTEETVLIGCVYNGYVPDTATTGHFRYTLSFTKSGSSYTLTEPRTIIVTSAYTTGSSTGLYAKDTVVEVPSGVSSYSFNSYTITGTNITHVRRSVSPSVFIVSSGLSGLAVSGDLLPYQTNTYKLGDRLARWNSLNINVGTYDGWSNAYSEISSSGINIMNNSGNPISGAKRTWNDFYHTRLEDLIYDFSRNPTCTNGTVNTTYQDSKGLIPLQDSSWPTSGSWSIDAMSLYDYVALKIVWEIGNTSTYVYGTSSATQHTFEMSLKNPIQYKVSSASSTTYDFYVGSDVTTGFPSLGVDFVHVIVYRYANGYRLKFNDATEGGSATSTARIKYIYGVRGY